MTRRPWPDRGPHGQKGNSVNRQAADTATPHPACVTDLGRSNNVAPLPGAMDARSHALRGRAGLGTWPGWGPSKHHTAPSTWQGAHTSKRGSEPLCSNTFPPHSPLPMYPTPVAEAAHVATLGDHPCSLAAWVLWPLLLDQHVLTWGLAHEIRLTLALSASLVASGS